MADELQSYITRSAIPFVQWSMKVNRDGIREKSSLGQIVSQIEELEQGIANLIGTPVLSVPTMPQKGTDLLPHMDRPPAIAIPKISVGIWDGLTDWHPRIQLVDVQVKPKELAATDLSEFTTRIRWQPVESMLAEILQTDITVSRNALLALKTQPVRVAA